MTPAAENERGRSVSFGFGFGDSSFIDTTAEVTTQTRVLSEE
jgi:hypothetical protein